MFDKIQENRMKKQQGQGNAIFIEDENGVIRKMEHESPMKNEPAVDTKNSSKRQTPISDKNVVDI